MTASDEDARAAGTVGRQVLHAGVREHGSGPPVRSQRLPAFGRQLRDAIRAGLRPRKLEGAVLVTTRWDYALAAAPARLVCPPEYPTCEFDFALLAGLQVVVLVPSVDATRGALIAARIREMGATLVVLAVNREDGR